MSDMGAATWGALTPLADEDAQILALETGSVRGHTLKVLLMENAPDDSPTPALRAAVAHRLGSLPRWRQRLVPAPGTPAGLAWQDDPRFRLDEHVREVASDGPVDERRLRDLVASVMAEPLDRDHPLWTVDVVPRLADGRWGLVWKVHHCLADGVTLMRVGPRLLWTQHQDEPAPPYVPRQSGRAATGGARTRVGDQAVTVARSLAVVRREFRRGPLTPLAGEVGTDRAVAFARCTLDELRSTGKRIDPGVTVNDVLLAVVAGALRRWLQARDRRGTGMKVQVPVSMHPSAYEDEPSGNRDSFLLVSLPVTEPDPVARVRRVHAETSLRKNRQDASTIYSLRKSLQHVPRPLRRGARTAVQGPHEYSLNVSNVPGPRKPISVLGDRVDAFYPVAEIAPRHALRVAAASMAGSLYVGLCADPAVVPDLDVLAQGFRLSVDELRHRLG